MSEIVFTDQIQPDNSTITHSFWRSVFKPRYIFPLLLLIWLCLSWFIANQVLLAHTQSLVNEEMREVSQQADKLSDSFKQVIQLQHNIPQLVAHDEHIAQVFLALDADHQTNQLSVAQRKQIWGAQFDNTNRYLNDVANLLDAQVVYLMNTAGDCIAASNAHQPDSFVGSNFSERVYFKNAMMGLMSTQYAVGKVSNVAGLYFSAPVYAQERLLGVVVSKLSIENLRHYVNQSDAFISDQYGVIILAADKRLEMQTLPNNALNRLSAAQRMTRYRRDHFNQLPLKSWLAPRLNNLYSLSGENKPLVLSASHQIEEDFNLTTYLHLPELTHFEQEKLQWSGLLAMLGSLLIVGLAWWRSVSQNKLKISLALRESEARFRTMANAAPALIWISDTHNQRVWCNQSWLAYTGRSPEGELKVNWQDDVFPNDLNAFQEFELTLKTQNYHPFELEYRLRRADGHYGWVMDTRTPYFDSHDQFQGYISYCWMIDRRKKNEDTILQHALFDSLTHLPNRRFLHNRLVDDINTSERERTYGAVMFMDLDNFKPINDIHGHAMGDKLLIEVAKRITSCMRQNDMVARYGGDEFVVVLSGLSSNPHLARTAAGLIADKIRLTLSKPYLLTAEQDGATSHIEHHCSSSIGVLLFFGDARQPEELLKLADDAMYLAKQAGKDSVKFCEIL